MRYPCDRLWYAASLEFVLRTERLALRRWAPEDAAGYLALYGDPEMTRYLRMPPCADLEAARARVIALIAAVETRGYGHWALVDLEDGALAGSAGFRPAMRDGDLELGFTVAPARWGRGYATEIAAATLALGFTRFAAARVHALAAPANLASRRVLEKIGMRYEGEIVDDGRTWSAYVASAGADRIR
jgi:RimJ/RimL family protein N-acetyltransferase